MRKGRLQGEGIEQARRSEAESLIKKKHLWLVPTWGCNRDETKDNRGICAICFAKDIMHHAGANGYKDPQADFYEKARALTKLPWMDVILTGGEPTLNRESLRETLSVIDPNSAVRIITNGDWLLKEDSKEEVVSIIKASGLDIKVEVSAHDPFEVFKRKIEGLSAKGIKFGAQFRGNENVSLKEVGRDLRASLVDDFSKIALVESIGGSLESHRVLRLGQAARGAGEMRPVFLKLNKLIEYTDRYENVGVYLMPGQNGTRVIVNHETPYLVFPTPADIVSPADSPERIVDKVVDYFASSSVSSDTLDDTAIAYAKAAFMAGVPLSFRGYEIQGADSENFEHYVGELGKREKGFFLDRARKLMNMYYELASEKFNIPVGRLRGLIAEKIAEHLLGLMKDGYRPSPYSGFGELSAVFSVGARPDLVFLPREEGIREFVQNTSDIIGGHNLMGKPFDALSSMKDPKLLSQLDVLDITPDAVSSHLKH